LKNESITNTSETTDESNGRRNFLRKTAYVAPVILTLQAFSAVAKAGSADVFSEDIDDSSKKPKKPKKTK
jgi:hypothetical protein